MGLRQGRNSLFLTTMDLVDDDKKNLEPIEGASLLFYEHVNY